MAKERKRLINEDMVQDVAPGHGQPGRDNPGQDRQDQSKIHTLRGNQIVIDSRPDLLN